MGPLVAHSEIVPPEITIETVYVGADAETVEQAVATPIEQQMSGVDDMNYMTSINASNGVLRMFVNFDVRSNPNTDHVLTMIRQNQSIPLR
jgi:HAE1 family hydrophobic/amphiphilic exporter-1